ncbi:hypothetical protein R80B4_00883 [Fibrobacteres bacterium R8-0-B4]
MTCTSTHNRRVVSINIYTRCPLLLLPLLLSALVCPARSDDDTLFHIYSRATPQSAVSRSFAGAGSALPHDIFQGLANPALTSVKIGAKGAYEAGYGRDDVFNKLALPFGAVFFDNGGAMGVFYRYLNGERGAVHEAAVNFSGRLFDQADPEEKGPGPVDFGMNVRYENSKWRHDVPIPVAEVGGESEGSEPGVNTITARGNSLLLDIGFYQRYLPGFDFSLVFSNITGYRWSEADGRGRSEGWIDGRHRLITAGMLYSLPITGTFLLRIPIDVEMANVFVKSRSTAYMLRAGAELRIASMYSARFGYARAPEDPAELITNFDYDNLFFGGVGVAVKSFLLDVFVGKREFGVTVTYGY